MLFSSTIAAVATPPGIGGIAVLRISGPDAYDVVERIFRPKNKNKSIINMQGHTAVYGDIVGSSGVIDDGVALCFRAPHSYTGEDTIEISCHGSEVICREVLMACHSAGAVPAEKGEYTKRAYLNGKMTLAQAEAVMEVISAKTMRGATLAEAQLNGAINQEINSIKDDLISAAAHLAAWIDYPEEGIEAVERDSFLATVRKNRERMAKLIDQYDKGAVLRSGIKAVIAGSPNVGKSTLFNLLSGIDRSIVTNVAGTTRDVVMQEINIGGINFQVSDTAGLRESPDLVEAEGIKRSYGEIEDADVIIAVFDGSSELDAPDRELIEICKGRSALCIVNKVDLGLKINEDELKKHFDHLLVMSANDTQYREKIENVVSEMIDQDYLEPGAPVLINERQLSMAIKASDALNEAENTITSGMPFDIAGICLEEALDSLAILIGENASDSVVNEVFDKFCVGK